MWNANRAVVRPALMLAFDTVTMLDVTHLKTLRFYNGVIRITDSQTERTEVTATV